MLNSELTLMTAVFNPDKIISEQSCPFCRSPLDMLPITKKQLVIRERSLESRAEKGESRALLELAWIHEKGKSASALDKLGIGENELVVDSESSPDGDKKAFDYLQQAASLGNHDAYFELAILNRKEYKTSEFFACLEKAAALGNIEARNELAFLAMEMKQFKVAMAHYKILAAIGYSKESTEKLTVGFKDGYVTKDELESAIRAYHASRDELCSTDRIRHDRIGAGVSSDGKSSKSSGMFI